MLGNWAVLGRKEEENFLTLPVELLHGQFATGKSSVPQKIRCNLCAAKVIFHM